ncbi:MAG: glycoside hydrolase family 13 protein [Bacteroidota bacterium]
MMFRNLIFCLLLAFFMGQEINLRAQSPIQRVEPPNWWVGMKEPGLQLMVHGENIANYEVKVAHEGVKLERVIKVTSPNYLFLDLHIAPSAKPGKVALTFADGKKTMDYQWELWEREDGSAERKGFSNKDVLYLITPDRFANGDPSNDMVEGMREKPNRKFKGGRHGGDIEGIRQHLDYIADMGFTAIWVNPVLENDMEEYSYHGYSTTDFYKVDPRFGSNESYRSMAREAREKGISLIMDMIVNHCGSLHWWMEDMPSEDWINVWPTYTGTNHRKSLWQDPYASSLDRKIFADGWFVPTMPDLNQRNQEMATYLTQNAIWWIEYLGLSGIRMDTYPYPEQDYMTEWTRRVMEEYPNFNVVGEEWYNDPSIVAYWQRGKQNPNGYTSDLPSLMDFPLQETMARALVTEESWGDGWIDLYERLAQDFMYADPHNLVVFPDNHDMSRIFSQLNEDIDLFNLAMAYTATIRGIPQIYYGTEILMKNPGTTDHGIIRSDFPGGWAGDKVNAASGEGLSKEAKAAQAMMKKLLNWRKSATAVHTGKLIHFVPEESVYVYFRYDAQQKIMVILNKNKGDYELNLDRFAEVLQDAAVGQEVLSGRSYRLEEKLALPPMTPLILELK